MRRINHSSRFFSQFADLPFDHKWKDVLTIINGKAYGEEYKVSGTYPICGSGGIMGYGEKKMCDRDSIILGRKGNIDKPIYMSEDYWIVDTAFCLSPNTELIHPVYLYYWCKQFDFQKLNKQAVLPSLTRSDLEQIDIQVPEMAEQLAFVEIVHQVDKSKFSDFKSRFIEMFGNPVTNTKSWPTKALSEVAPESPSTNKATGLVWVLNLDMVESQSGRVIEKVYDNVENLNSVAPFDDGNVLFSKLRPYLNKVVIPNGKGYATTELVPLRPNTTFVRKEFLACLLRSNDFVNYADAIATGTKMPRMPMTALRDFKCIIPPVDLQDEFLKVSQQADKSKYLN